MAHCIHTKRTAPPTTWPLRQPSPLPFSFASNKYSLYRQSSEHSFILQSSVVYALSGSTSFLVDAHEQCARQQDWPGCTPTFYYLFSSFLLLLLFYVIVFTPLSFLLYRRTTDRYYIMAYCSVFRYKRPKDQDQIRKHLVVRKEASKRD